MAWIYDLMVGAGIGTIILYIIYKVRTKDLVEPFNLVQSIFESYFSGMTIYMGLAAVYYSFSGSLPFNLSTIANEKMISFFGGITIIVITAILLFRKEILSKGKFIFFKDEEKDLSEISVERINYCVNYHKFKEAAKNPEMNVIKFFKNKTIQVDTRKVYNNLTKGMLFDLMIRTTETLEGEKKEIPSPPLAVCQLNTSSSISTFNIIKWFKIKEYKSVMKDFKSNKKLNMLKPFIKLRTDHIADKYSYNDLVTVKQGIDNLIKAQGVE